MESTLDPNAVFKKMGYYCAYRERSYREVRTKLLEYKLSHDQHEDILIQLKKEGYYNEERFACAFARGKFRIKKWGKIKIMQQLHRHEISQEFIAQGLKEIDDNDYYATLIEIVKKKGVDMIKSGASNQYGKLAQHAMQKGYEPELVRRTVDEFFKKNNSRTTATA